MGWPERSLLAAELGPDDCSPDPCSIPTTDFWFRGNGGPLTFKVVPTGNVAVADCGFTGDLVGFCLQQAFGQNTVSVSDWDFDYQCDRQISRVHEYDDFPLGSDGSNSNYQIELISDPSSVDPRTPGSYTVTFRVTEAVGGAANYCPESAELSLPINIVPPQGSGGVRVYVASRGDGVVDIGHTGDTFRAGWGQIVSYFLEQCSYLTVLSDLVLAHEAFHRAVIDLLETLQETGEAVDGESAMNISKLTVNSLALALQSALLLDEGFPRPDLSLQIRKNSPLPVIDLFTNNHSEAAGARVTVTVERVTPEAAASTGGGPVEDGEVASFTVGCDSRLDEIVPLDLQTPLSYGTQVVRVDVVNGTPQPATVSVNITGKTEVEIIRDLFPTAQYVHRTYDERRRCLEDMVEVIAGLQNAMSLTDSLLDAGGDTLDITQVSKGVSETLAPLLGVAIFLADRVSRRIEADQKLLDEVYDEAVLSIRTFVDQVEVTLPEACPRGGSENDSRWCDFLCVPRREADIIYIQEQETCQ